MGRRGRYIGIGVDMSIEIGVHVDMNMSLYFEVGVGIRVELYSRMVVDVYIGVSMGMSIGIDVGMSMGMGIKVVLRFRRALLWRSRWWLYLQIRNGRRIVLYFVTCLSMVRESDSCLSVALDLPTSIAIHLAVYT